MKNLLVATILIGTGFNLIYYSKNLSYFLSKSAKKQWDMIFGRIKIFPSSYGKHYDTPGYRARGRIICICIGTILLLRGIIAIIEFIVHGYITW